MFERFKKSHKIARVVSLTIVLLLLVNILPHNPMTEVYAESNAGMTAQLSLGVSRSDSLFAAASFLNHVNSDESDGPHYEDRMKISELLIRAYEYDEKNPDREQFIDIYHYNKANGDELGNVHFKNTTSTLKGNGSFSIKVAWYDSRSYNGYMPRFQTGDSFSFDLLYFEGLRNNYSDSVEINLSYKDENDETVEIEVGTATFTVNEGLLSVTVVFSRNLDDFFNVQGFANTTIGISWDKTSGMIEIPELNENQEYAFSKEIGGGGSAEQTTAYIHFVKTGLLNGKEGLLEDGSEEEGALPTSTLEGFQFKVCDESGNILYFNKKYDESAGRDVYRWVTAGKGSPVVETDQNGRFTLSFSGRSPGYNKFYLIEESKPDSSYYTRSTKQWHFELDEYDANQKVRYYAINNIPKVMELRKVDEDRKALAGAEFTLHRYSESGSSQPFTNLVSLQESGGLYEYSADKYTTSNLVTDSKGIIRIQNLPEGHYYFKEEIAPKDYQKTETLFEFYVYDDYDRTVSASTETTYTGWDQEQNILVVTATNIPIDQPDPERPQLKKVDQEGNGLAGAEFLLEGNGRKETLKTGSNGTVIFPDNLADGAYTLTEIKAPEGYILNSTPVEVVVSGSGAAIQLNGTYVHVKQEKNTLIITNEPEEPDEPDKPGLEKVDSSGKALSGAVFTLVNDGTSVTTTYTTNSSGRLFFDGLADGIYTLTETKAPSGYILNSQPIKIEIGGSGTTIRLIDADKYPHVLLKGKTLIVKNEPEQPENPEIPELKKVDKDGNRLGGAEFALRKASGGTITYLHTGSTGVINFPALEDGEYILWETKAPDGYVLNSQEIRIKVSGNGSKVELMGSYGHATLAGNQLIVTNEPDDPENPDIPGLKKVDENGNGLAGAEFAIKRENGGLVTTISTGNSSTLVLPRLEDGNYILLETKAPNGYALNTTEIKFTVSANGETITLQGNYSHVKLHGNQLVIANKKNPTDPGDSPDTIDIVKEDSGTGARLSEATFKITDGSGNLILTGTTNSSGLMPVNTDKLKRHTQYYLTELTAPKGYQLLARSIPFTLDDSYKVVLGSNESLARITASGHGMVVLNTKDNGNGSSSGGDGGGNGGSSGGGGNGNGGGSSGGGRPRPDIPDRIDKDRDSGSSSSRPGGGPSSSPLTEIAEDPVPLTTIPDDPVPLGGGTPIPSTGTDGKMPAMVLITLLSAIVIGCCGKKR